MNFTSLISVYLMLNFLVAVAFVCLLVVHRLFNIGARSELQLNYRAASFLLATLLLQVFLPNRSFIAPAVKVWAAPSLHAFPKDYSERQDGFVRLENEPAIPESRLAGIWLVLAFAVFAGGAFRMSRDLRFLWKLKKRSFLIRKIGKVRIFVHDDVGIPFSYRGLGRAIVVIPTRLVFNNEDFKIAVSHELQHHRQRDTVWQYLFWLLRLLCVCNPCVYLWNRNVSELQEFACDEALAGRRFSSYAYVRCLIEVAQYAFDQERRPVGATGMAFLTGRNLLKRRIEKMMTTNKTSNERRLQFACLGLISVLMVDNIGEQRTQEGIVKTGSRDAWELIRAGYENDTEYLARFMAAVLIMKNPAVVQ